MDTRKYVAWCVLVVSQQKYQMQKNTEVFVSHILLFTLF